MYNADQIAVISLSVYDILNDQTFKEALEHFGWTQTPQATVNGHWFYNNSQNVALVFEQKTNFVEITPRNVMSSMNDVMEEGAKSVSSKQEAINFAIKCIERYANINIFEDTNSFLD